MDEVNLRTSIKERQNLIEVVETISGEKLVLDGESEVDDVVLASCFAERDNLVLHHVEESTRNLFSLKTFLYDVLYKTQSDALKNLQNNDGSLFEDSSNSSEDERDELSEKIDTDCEIVRKNETSTGLEENADKKESSSVFDEDGENLNGADNAAFKYCGLEPIPTSNIPINIPEHEELVHFGFIVSVVNSLIIVQSEQAAKPLDLGSVVVMQNYETIGVISDTFGPVRSPFYAICVEDKFKTKYDIGERVYTIKSQAFFLVDEDSKLSRGFYEKFDTESTTDEESLDELSKPHVERKKVKQRESVQQSDMKQQYRCKSSAASAKKHVVKKQLERNLVPSKICRIPRKNLIPTNIINERKLSHYSFMLSADARNYKDDICERSQMSLPSDLSSVTRYEASIESFSSRKHERVPSPYSLFYKKHFLPFPSAPVTSFSNQYDHMQSNVELQRIHDTLPNTAHGRHLIHCSSVKTTNFDYRDCMGDFSKNQTGCHYNACYTPHIVKTMYRDQCYNSSINNPNGPNEVYPMTRPLYVDSEAGSVSQYCCTPEDGQLPPGVLH